MKKLAFLLILCPMLAFTCEDCVFIISQMESKLEELISNGNFDQTCNVMYYEGVCRGFKEAQQILISNHSCEIEFLDICWDD